MTKDYLYSWIETASAEAKAQLLSALQTQTQTGIVSAYTPISSMPAVSDTSAPAYSCVERGFKRFFVLDCGSSVLILANTTLSGDNLALYRTEDVDGNFGDFGFTNKTYQLFDVLTACGAGEASQGGGGGGGEGGDEPIFVDARDGMTLDELAVAVGYDTSSGGVQEFLIDFAYTFMGRDDYRMTADVRLEHSYSSYWNYSFQEIPSGAVLISHGIKLFMQNNQEGSSSVQDILVTTHTASSQADYITYPPYGRIGNKYLGDDAGWHGYMDLKTYRTVESSATLSQIVGDLGFGKFLIEFYPNDSATTDRGILTISNVYNGSPAYQFNYQGECDLPYNGIPSARFGEATYSGADAETVTFAEFIATYVPRSCMVPYPPNSDSADYTLKFSRGTLQWVQDE